MDYLYDVAIVVYVVLFIIKALLMMPSVPLAFSVMTARLNDPPSKVILYPALMVASLVTLAFMLIPALFHERLKFFLLYTDDDVIRQITGVDA